VIVDLAHDPAGFRAALSDWLGKVLAPGWRETMESKGAGEEAYIDFQRWWFGECRKQGLILPDLPVAFGGAGLSIELQMMVVEHFARTGVPPLRGGIYTVAHTHVPATLLHAASEEQRARYLPGLIEGDVWCQGFSEPGAGSDLASLRTRAVREGDHFVINGQKLWSSFAQHAKYCLLLARTDPEAPKHRGISYMIMDMAGEGVEVRPIRQATGHEEFCELFLTDVRVPVANLIGAENAGWATAQATLAAERGVLAFERVERARRELERFLERERQSNAPWLGREADRAEFAALVARLQAIRRMVRRLLADDGNGAAASRLPAFIKLLSTEFGQVYSDFRIRVAGLPGQLDRPSLPLSGSAPLHDYLNSFGDTISAGSNEIMRNLIAERVLGLPR
jgi:alkylation response protein AidB-like acyl-CoA dehydrogenase